MLSRVLEYVGRYGMIEVGDHVAAGVSGGADSVCLLLALEALRETLRFELTAVHVEHGIRGRAALEDAAFVESLCRERGIPLRVFHVNVPEKAAGEGLGLEEAGRALRYACFSRVCRENGADKIAVAHHRDDQAETVLFHLFRGSGLGGLCGMEPVRGNVIRPLLGVSRREIEEWLAGKGISWRMDETNLQADFARNKLRLHVLPYVQREIQSQAATHVAEAAGRLRQVKEYLDKKAEEAYAACAAEEKGQIRLELAVFWQQEELMRTMALQRALLLLGRGLKDISALHLEGLLELAGKESGKELCLPYGIRARREYGYLVLEEAPGRQRDRTPDGDGESGRPRHKGKEAAPLAVEAQIPGIYEINGLVWEFSVENVKNYQGIPEKTYTKWFDYDTIKKCLAIRTRRAGDFLEINREHGRKKLKDYLIDQKVPRGKREELLLLAEGSHVLWVFGMRISEAYKVTEKTRRLLKVAVSGGTDDDGKDKGDDSGEGTGFQD